MASGAKMCGVQTCVLTTSSIKPNKAKHRQKILFGQHEDTASIPIPRFDSVQCHVLRWRRSFHLMGAVPLTIDHRSLTDKIALRRM